MILKSFLLLLLLLILLCLMPFKFRFRIYRRAEKVSLLVFFPLRKNPWTIEINNLVTLVFWGLSEDRFWQKQIPQDLQFWDIAWRKVFYRLVHFQEIRRNVAAKTRRFLPRVVGSLKIIKLDLKIDVALQNMAQTALAVGFLWWGWGIFFSLLGDFFRLPQTTNNIVIVPNYQTRNLLELDFSCIVEFTFGHIIIISYYLCRNAGKIKRLLGRIKQ